MGLSHRVAWLISLILFLVVSISFGQIERPPRERNVKSLFFNPKVHPDDIRKVVVLPIHAKEVMLEHAPWITDLLLANLRAVGKYDILPAQDLKGLVKERGMDWAKIHYYAQALDIGKSLGVDGVLVGSLSQYGQMGQRARFGLNLRMIRIKQGDTVWSMSCSAKGKPKEMRSIAKGSIESIIRTLVHRWQSDKATTAWGIKLQPLKASHRRRHIIIRVPKYGETEIKEYIVSRSVFESGPYKVIKRLKQRKWARRSFKDRNVRAGWNYFYRYRVLTEKGFLSPFSEAVEARLSIAPATSQPLGRRRGES